MRHAARTDSNQAEIMAALRRVGVSVEYIKLPFDCVYFNPRNKEMGFLEIKTENGRLTKAQVEFIRSWPGPIRVARTPEDALRQILGEGAFG